MNVIMIASILMYAPTGIVLDMEEYSMDKNPIMHLLVKVDSTIELYKTRRVLYQNTDALVHLNLRVNIKIKKDSMILNVNQLLINAIILQHLL